MILNNIGKVIKYNAKNGDIASDTAITVNRIKK